MTDSATAAPLLIFKPNDDMVVHRDLLRRTIGSLQVLVTDLTEAADTLRTLDRSADGVYLPLPPALYQSLHKLWAFDPVCCDSKQQQTVFSVEIADTYAVANLKDVLLGITDSNPVKDDLGHSHERSTPLSLIHEHEGASAGDQHEQIVAQQFPGLTQGSNPAEEE